MSRQVREFEALTRPHLPAAFKLAYWLLRNPHDAEDVVQDAFLKAFKHFDHFDGGEIRPWLMKIVRNAAIDALKKKRAGNSILSYQQAFGVAGDHEPVEERIASEAPSPEASLIEGDIRSVVIDTINSLGPHYREILVLRELDGMSYREISEIIGLPVGTVMSRLSRAREVLRTALGPLKKEIGP